MVTDPFEYARRGARRTEPDDPLVADFKRERQERTAYQIKLSPPSETVAKSNALARRVGVPAPIVQENLTGYQAKEHIENAMEVFSRFGNISRWADKEERNAAAVADDWESLGLMGQVWETMKVAPGAVADSLETGSLVGGQLGDDYFHALDDFNRFATYPIRAGLASVENAIFGTNTMDPDRAAQRSREAYEARRAPRAALIEEARPQFQNFWAKNLLSGVESIPATSEPMTMRSGSRGAILFITVDVAQASDVPEYIR